MNRIQSRSPYFVKHTETNLTSAILEVWIYTGTRTTSRPASATATLQIEAYDEVVVSDISQFVSDEVSIIFDGSYSDSLMVWVDYQLTPFVLEVEQTPETLVALEGFVGFRDFQDGAQNISRADDTNKLLMSNRIIYRPAGAYINIPVLKDSSYIVGFENAGGEVLYQESITNSLVSSTRLSYMNDSGTAGLDSFIDRVIADGGTVVESSCLKNLLCNDFAGLSRISIDGEIITVKTLEPSKYPYYKLTFINKFGALQDMYFTGKSQKKLNATAGSSYRRNTLVDDSYSINKHVKLNQTKNGVESLSLSTGFLDEGHNEVFRQIQLSTALWIEIDGVTLPVEVKDSGMVYKTSVNDNLIAFKIDVDFAFNTINDIR